MYFNVLNKSLNWTQVCIQVEQFNRPKQKCQILRLQIVKRITSKWKLNINDRSHVSTVGVTKFFDMHTKLQKT